jgi:hypothetical protein
MATIKAYTDLSQSERLKEILPSESADMEYMFLKKMGAKLVMFHLLRMDLKNPNVVTLLFLVGVLQH